ncbi:peptidoglycan DD-metalloendopeptidase family protein [Aeromicrobium stalagmiti]|uniref:peptidoglycan DD-metalloendopeptidase family protein n=1 Tax=Aeromicrobium stalagmiti TaxID=2738988 RepID=UPI001C2BD127|nr:peptidoglycan DD-metalloendopeptidase family protein [Aeromicrobium stalagmiti]
MTRRLVTLLIVIALLPSAASAGSPDAWSWPLDDPSVGRRFDPPADAYGAGHRGVDIAASVGTPVRAVAAGRVAFVGEVGGVPVISIDHGVERSTYQPVRALVEVGDAVEARDVIGTLLGTHSHCVGACLHLGRRVGRDYLDPLDLLGGGRFRLISPDGPPPSPPAGVGGDLRRPVGGPVTSPFGMRVHPVTGVRKLHDGTDFGVPCGTPVHAAAAGTVTTSGHAGAYGRRVTVRHSPGLETTYNHLSSQSVSVGERVEAGDVVGLVGSTGLSTGCHLHFMVLKDGRPVNPQDSL